MSPAASRWDDRGAALVEYVLVSLLVVLLVVGVIQLTLALHVRNILASAAHEGARYAASYDVDTGSGAIRARQMIDASLGGYPVTVSARESSVGGLDTVSVAIEGPVPVFGLWGVGSVRAEAHAAKERDRG